MKTVISTKLGLLIVGVATIIFGGIYTYVMLQMPTAYDLEVHSSSIALKTEATSLEVSPVPSADTQATPSTAPTTSVSPAVTTTPAATTTPTATATPAATTTPTARTSPAATPPFVPPAQ